MPQSDIFDAAIPGQSLTQPQGASVTEYPPQYASVDDALEYLLDKLSQRKQVVRIALMLKKGMPVEYLARAILFQGFTSGKWTPDAALLMLRIVMAMIIAIATNAGVKDIKILNEDKKEKEFLDQFIDDGELSAESEVPDSQEEVAGKLPEFKGILGGL